MKNSLRIPLIVVGVAALATGVWYGLDNYISPADSKERKDFVLLVVQTLGVMALAAGGYLTFRRVRAAEDTVRIAEEGQITERFTRSIDQLGSDNLAVRLGGIYALERIAKASRQDHWPIMEVLTAYVKNRSSELFKSELGGGLKPEVEPDIQAILTVIGRREERWRQLEIENLDLSSTFLKGSNLNGAHLEEADLRGANLEGSNLTDAHLEEADLRSANLEGSNLTDTHLERADLRGAHLEGLNFTDGHLEGAYLNEAHLKGADFSRAHLEKAYLSDAHLEGADFNYAHLEGADLNDAHLEGALLNGAYLEEAELYDTHLEGAFFLGAHLQGAKLSRAHLEGANLTNALGLTQDQIDLAHIDGTTLLPDNLSATKTESNDQDKNE